jgi:LysM repeat protein
MRWRKLLILSACVNAVLLATVWHYARKSSVPAPTLEAIGTNDVKYRTHVVVRRQFFTWDQVESSDYATYIANLRDIGCPEQTIRDIIIADVNAVFAKRIAAEVRTPDQQWWRSMPDARLSTAATAKLRELEQERRTLLTSLLGPGWGESSLASLQPARAAVVLDGPVLGNLPTDTKASVNQAVAASQARLEALYAKAESEGRNPTAAELAAVREQTRVELQKILAPAQLEEFLLRYSQNASNLRSQLGEMKYFSATPDEFRALFRVTDQFDQKLAALADSTDPNDIRQRQSLEAQRERAIKLALGDQRYALYQRLQDPNYRDAYAQATAAGTPGAAQTVYAVNQATDQEIARTLNQSSNLTPEQLAVALKRVELQQLEATTAAVGQEVPPDPNAPPPPPAPPEPQYHTIRAGDTLGALSTRYGMPVNVILDANPNLQINTLKPGQRITIPTLRQPAAN